MKRRRYEQLLSTQTQVAKKVFNAVSTTEAWPSKRIYQELMNSDSPVRDMRLVDGCLASLAKSKLLTENPRGMFIRVVPTDGPTETESVPAPAPAPAPTKARPDAQQIERWSQPKPSPVVEEKPTTPVVPTPEPPPPAVSAPPAPAPAPPSPEAPVASDVPQGHFTQYLLPKHDILINYPNSGGVQDYRIMRAAQPGEVVRFARPEGISLSSWRGRIGAMRHNYYNKYGLLIEAHFFHGYVDLQVMREDKATPQHALHVTEREPDAAEERAFPTRPLGTTEVVVDGHPAAMPVVEEAVPAPTPTVEPTTGEPSDPDAYLANEDNLPPSAEAASEEAPAPTEEKSASTVERVFWQRIFALKVGQGSAVDEATAFADAALSAQRRRFA